MISGGPLQPLPFCDSLIKVADKQEQSSSCALPLALNKAVSVHCFVGSGTGSRVSPGALAGLGASNRRMAETKLKHMRE